MDASCQKTPKKNTRHRDNHQEGNRHTRKQKPTKNKNLKKEILTYFVEASHPQLCRGFTVSHLFLFIRIFCIYSRL